MDVCRQQAPAFASVAGGLPEESLLRQYLTRWSLDWPAPGAVTMERLSDVVCEYPRIDERRTGAPQGHGFVACAGGPGTGDLFHRAVGLDLDSREMHLHHAGDRRAVSEPIFVPRRAGAPEGVGYLLTTVFDEGRNASHLAIFDAQQLERGPLARAHLDHRVPMGFHGTWAE